MGGPYCLTEEQSDSIGVRADEAQPSWCVFKPAKKSGFIFYIHACIGILTCNEQHITIA